MDNEKGIGATLEEARLAKGLSFAQIEEKTNIRANYLEAIEKEQFDKIPGEVFAKGMIRTYGNFLGLDGNVLVSLYKARRSGKSMEEVAASSGPIPQTSNVKMNISLKQKRDWGSGNGFSLSSLKLPGKQIAMGVAALAVLGIMYVAVPKIISMVATSREQAKVTEQVQKPEAVAEKAVINDKVEVTIEATGKCWTEAFGDGKELFAGMLSVGDKKSFSAKDKLIIKYGNIGAVKITVNGKLVDLQGEHGVATKTYAVGQPIEANEPVKEAKQNSTADNYTSTRKSVVAPVIKPEAQAPVAAPSVQKAVAPKAETSAKTEKPASMEVTNPVKETKKISNKKITGDKK